MPEDSGNRPKVSVHLPVYNERYVIRRLVSACTAMAEAYGKENVSIRILDDSNDDTTLEVDKIIGEYKKKHFNIEVVRRENRKGYKAGALQAALEKTDEEFTAIFDADFIPAPDFLLRTMPYFAGNEHLAIIQSRWTHLNRDYNLLTSGIAVGIDVHFLVEQTGRYAAGCLQNFNGSGGVIRKSAIQEAGGWQSDTLAEDLDLSYRIQLRGYKVLFLKDLLSPAEIPPTVPSFKKQQGRWACGSLRTAKKLLPELLHDRKLSFKQRLQAYIHLTGYLLHPLMLFSFLLICMGTIFDVNTIRMSNINSFLFLGDTQSISSFSTAMILQYLGGVILALAIALCSIAPWISMIVALKSQKFPLSRNIISVLIAFLLGFGICSSNTIEAGKALLTNRVWEFVRTPKYAEIQNDKDRKNKKYQVSLDISWILELVLICLGVFCIGIGIRNSNFFSLAVLIPYTIAFFFVFSLSIIQTRKGKAG
ncbi:MAG: glycosyltransferase family 2 protein [Flexilinea sp.]